MYSKRNKALLADKFSAALQICHKARRYADDVFEYKYGLNTMSGTPEYFLDLLGKLVEFSNEIRSENRFHLKSKTTVEEVFKYFQRVGTVSLKEGSKLYRARYDSGWTKAYQPIPLEEMGAPPPGKRRSGRINPEGIPCLYCATELKTAISEIRPWAGARVTVAEGMVRRDLKIVDVHLNFSNGEGKFDSLNHQLFELSVNSLFSARFSPEDASGYLPSQYIGEYFKINGFDGIEYWSSLSKTGKNIAIFDEQDVEFTSRRQFQITKVEYDFMEFPIEEIGISPDIPENEPRNI